MKTTYLSLFLSRLRGRTLTVRRVVDSSGKQLIRNALVDARFTERTNRVEHG
jgi:hypothetical protein